MSNRKRLPYFAKGRVEDALHELSCAGRAAESALNSLEGRPVNLLLAQRQLLDSMRRLEKARRLLTEALLQQRAKGDSYVENT